MSQILKKRISLLAHQLGAAKLALLVFDRLGGFPEWLEAIDRMSEEQAVEYIDNAITAVFGDGTQPENKAKLALVTVDGKPVGELP